MLPGTLLLRPDPGTHRLPGRLHHGAGAHVEDLAQHVELAQPAGGEGPGRGGRGGTSERQHSESIAGESIAQACSSLRRASYPVSCDTLTATKPTNCDSYQTKHGSTSPPPPPHAHLSSCASASRPSSSTKCSLRVSRMPRIQLRASHYRRLFDPRLHTRPWQRPDRFEALQALQALQELAGPSWHDSGPKNAATAAGLRKGFSIGT